MIRFEVYEDAASAERAVADMISDAVKAKSNCVLGLATGATPEGVYEILAHRCRDGAMDMSKVTTYNLDEYVGLPVGHRGSYRYYMDKHLFDRVNIDKANTYLPDPARAEADGTMAYYDKMIVDGGGIDLQLLGIGVNGHIGFNEPDDKLISVTHITRLTESTRQINSVYFDDGVTPMSAATMGIGTIALAKKIVLIATGAKKADAIGQLRAGIIDTRCPATMLNVMSDVTVVCDAAAYGRG